MDKVPTSRTTLVIGVLAGVACAGAVWLLLAGQPISGLRRTLTQTPGFTIALTVVGRDGEELPPGTSRFAAAKNESSASSTSAASSTTAAPSPSPSSTPTPTPNQLSLTLFHRPPAISLDVADGTKLLSWYDSDNAAKMFLASPAAQGILHDIGQTLKVRTEDLELAGFSGMTVATLFREALKAHASIHYDIFEGAKGFSFKFRRAEAPILARLLPVLVPAVSRRSYKVPNFSAPVEELTIGSQTFYLTEDKGNVLVSNGLKALLNLLDTEFPAAAPPANDSAVLTVRSETFLRSLLPLLAGQDSWNAHFEFALSDQASPELRLGLDPAKVFAHLRDKISPGIFAAIPQDVFGVFASSFALSSDMTPEAWNDLATKGIPDAPQKKDGEGGFAVIWDINAKSEAAPTAVGVALFVPDGANATMKLADYFNTESVFTGDCGGGTIWLASTDELLLTRMSEACQRQSKSFLNLFEKKTFSSVKDEPQLFVSLNPGAGLIAAQDVGLAARDAGESDEAAADASSASGAKTQTDWQEKYNHAVEETTKKAADEFSKLPSLVYLGRASAEGGVLTGVILGSNQS